MVASFEDMFEKTKQVLSNEELDKISKEIENLANKVVDLAIKSMEEANKVYCLPENEVKIIIAESLIDYFIGVLRERLGDDAVNTALRTYIFMLTTPQGTAMRVLFALMTDLAEFEAQRDYRK